MTDIQRKRKVTFTAALLAGIGALSIMLGVIGLSESSAKEKVGDAKNFITLDSAQKQHDTGMNENKNVKEKKDNSDSPGKKVLKEALSSPTDNSISKSNIDPTPVAFDLNEWAVSDIKGCGENLKKDCLE